MKKVKLPKSLCTIFIVSNLCFCALLAQDLTYMQRTEKRINELPLTWESGLKFTETCLDRRGFYSYSVDSGMYYNLHREKVTEQMFVHMIDVSNILFAYKYIYCYVENNKLKSDLDNVKTDNKILLAWVIELTIIDGKITKRCIQDWRGYPYKNGAVAVCEQKHCY